LIPDIEKFLPVAIFKMATTIPHKFNIVSISTSWIDSRHQKILILISQWTSKETRYDYNLTIMKSPKLATDNRFKKLIKSYLWNRTMLNFCGIVVAILKMETGRNFLMSRINSGGWNRNNVEFVRYCGGHFENGDLGRLHNR
jgi:hypothetical protein